MAYKSIDCGVARGAIVTIHCDREALEWLLDYLPPNDGFTKDIRDASLKATAEVEIIEHAAETGAYL